MKLELINSWSCLIYFEERIEKCNNFIVNSYILLFKEDWNNGNQEAIKYVKKWKENWNSSKW